MTVRDEALAAITAALEGIPPFSGTAATIAEAVLAVVESSPAVQAVAYRAGGAIVAWQWPEHGSQIWETRAAETDVPLFRPSPAVAHLLAEAPS